MEPSHRPNRLPAPARGPRPLDYGFVALQHLLPQRLLTAIALRGGRSRRRWWAQAAIRWFIGHYGVDMGSAEQPDPAAYPDFNSFFTRALRPGARPIAADPDAVASPVDGALYAIGRADGGRLFQAKGRDYSLAQLLGGTDLSGHFTGGACATLYLAPRDYHRVHMPLAGRLRLMRYIPGCLFSVNATTAHAVPGLFARNERLVTVFDTEAGPMALILVGAMLVAGIETVWSDGLVRGGLRDWHYDGAAAPSLARGAEMGRFNMGSTVIVLFAPGRVAWDPGAVAGRATRMGELLGRLSAAAGD